MAITSQDPLITTKLTPPRRGRGVLARPRLERLIDAISHTTLSVLKAPPGFGKTTLATAWADAAQARGGKVAWLTLDETDDSSPRLLFYMAAAFHRGFAGTLFTDTARLQELGRLPAEHLLSQLLQEIEQSQVPCYLFIDDYHCVPSEVLEQALGPLIRYAPDNLHLLLAGRCDPPPSLYQYLYDDAVLTLDVAQLRFTLGETCELIASANQGPFSPADIQELQHSSEGWIAALRARLLILQQNPQSTRMSGQGLTSLFDDVLARLPCALAEQLPALSVVDKFSAPLVEQLTACHDGQGLIHELENRQLFLCGLDESGTWFSLHPLFREHLRQRLRRIDGSELQALQRAAHWFAEQQLWANAVQSALNAGDEEHALQWIAQCAMPLVEQGDILQLLDWQRRLHDHLLQSPPQLKLALAWAAALAMRGKDAHGLLNEARHDLRRTGEPNSSNALNWECQALEAMLLARDDEAQAGGQLAQQCLPHLSAAPWIMQVLRNVLSFSHLQACDWRAFYSMPALAYSPQDHERYLFALIYQQCLLGIGELRQGRLSQAVAIFEEAMRQAAPPHSLSGASPVLRALPAALLSCVRYQQGHLDEARLLNLESLEIAKLVGFLDCAADALICASRLASCQGNTLDARRLLSTGENLAQNRHWPRLQILLLLERIRCGLTERHDQEALACYHQLAALCETLPIERIEYLGLDSLARLWLEAAGLPIQADLHHALTESRRAIALNLCLRQIELQFAIALVAWQRQQPELAIEQLLHAATRLKHSEAPRLLLDHPCRERLKSMLAACQESGRSEPGQRVLLKELEHSLTPMVDGTDAPPASNLTSKERQIMELVASGKSNKEMAKLLNVTPETIKSHMKSIFQKLEVDSRAQAAVKAKAIGLVVNAC
ncbi:hypothetical protein F753_15970 [Stutzerimonas chloritidismutans AW-1]|jgi:LuxR family maltose regulon positive regulatory protein|uniref:HTH luxR-type domain-containing protein n=1 Tax=Stutzerimonas chloritidismutans AW-1 TaxID=1263865 RepID=V4RZ18_STUCH|nr:LuxR C-terminal-related transcriptional regulator [Stutzerimonas chloritidismutans]ESQ98396.1 hypothetical protein F753_15970 [Stutzerimonas chloritidismutans AW-1]